MGHGEGDGALHGEVKESAMSFNRLGAAFAALAILFILAAFVAAEL